MGSYQIYDPKSVTVEFVVEGATENIIFWVSAVRFGRWISSTQARISNVTNI
jgi:hypothetical protein